MNYIKVNMLILLAILIFVGICLASEDGKQLLAFVVFGAVCLGGLAIVGGAILLFIGSVSNW